MFLIRERVPAPDSAAHSVTRDRKITRELPATAHYMPGGAKSQDVFTAAAAAVISEYSIPRRGLSKRDFPDNDRSEEMCYDILCFCLGEEGRV